MAGTLKYKDINFYEIYNKKPEKSKAQKDRKKIILSIILIVFVLGSVYGFLEYQSYLSARQLEKIKTYTKNPAYVSLYKLSQEQEVTLSKKREEKGNLLRIQKALESYPVLSNDEFDALKKAGLLDIITKELTYDHESAKLSFIATVHSVGELPAYIDRVRQTGIFNDIVYEGYTATKNNQFDFVVSCILKTEDK
ncbi:MAG: hypothetical protein K0R90_1536 [Oscillospiraceae bacterium]|jgi:hypothetical protein|nr:hypothetical protein [Oscillospiraceae bacterium]